MFARGTSNNSGRSLCNGILCLCTSVQNGGIIAVPPATDGVLFSTILAFCAWTQVDLEAKWFLLRSFLAYMHAQTIFTEILNDQHELCLLERAVLSSPKAASNTSEFSSLAHADAGHCGWQPVSEVCLNLRLLLSIRARRQGDCGP